MVDVNDHIWLDVIYVAVEHRFDIKIVSVRGLTLDENMHMGEADCFVQYHFPTQSNSGV